jgi:predicted RNA-binding protein YlxR (DUF448 family)
MAAKQRRRVPQRTCVVCREKRDKRQLTRIVHNADAGVVADPSGKLAGRGAYICDRAACWQRALTSEVLDRALRTSVSAAAKEALAAARPMPVEEESTV